MKVWNLPFAKIYYKRDDFDFDMVNFPFLDAMSPGVPNMGYTYLNIIFAQSFFKS